MQVLWLVDLEVAVLVSAVTVCGVTKCRSCRRTRLDVVWWQLLGNVGQEVRLVEVREWVEQRKQVTRAFAEQRNDG